MTRRITFQTGSVILRNGKWTLRYREYDHTAARWKNCRTILGVFKNRKDALEASAPIMAQVNERNNMDASQLAAGLTFEAFIRTRWQAYTKQGKHQVSTIDTRRSVIDTHLLPFFGEMKMRDVKPTDIANFLDSRRPDYSDSSMHTFYSILRVVFDIAQQFDIIEKSPVRPKRHRIKVEKVEKPTLTAEQIRNVLEHLEDEQERLFALLLAVTGMRVHEAMALRWLDFDVDALAISINHTLYKKKLKAPKTEASSSRLRLHPEIAGLLLAHRHGSGFSKDRDFIFCLADGSPLIYWSCLRRFHAAVEAAGITRQRAKHGFHILRHSAGTLLYTKSRDLKLVQGTLRHAELSTTSDIYVHLTDKVLNEGSAILADEILENCVLFVPKRTEKAG